jgi:hypothetical protein
MYRIFFYIKQFIIEYPKEREIHLISNRVGIHNTKLKKFIIHYHMKSIYMQLNAPNLLQNTILFEITERVSYLYR